MRPFVANKGRRNEDSLQQENAAVCDGAIPKLL